jgi:hypothetical protein
VPVQIHELVIRAALVEQPKREGARALDEEALHALKQDILRECLRQVRHLIGTDRCAR